ncbi:MAG: FMN-binding glutamate synthase family protein [Bacteroidia bacterium]|nr:FMN-binding glutamate synthase family protein [Bacteroidia bacterium]
MRNQFIIFSILLISALAGIYFLLWPPIIWSMVGVGPLLLLGFYDLVQTKHTIARNFPVLGRGRYIMEWMRPKLYQYFIESDIDGRPFSRTNRSVIYQRAKNVRDTTPFGTQLNVYEEGYEWMNHSIAALDHRNLPHHPRVTVGGPDCKQPYDLSLLNISAMSYGSLSKNAILALNGGAKIGGFAHNTGEGGVSHYHLEPGGDLIYQVGTGYFGSRDPETGRFSRKHFEVSAGHPQVKMIELKLSQGAKPGHGGILPASKNTPEIAKIRGVKPGTEVDSPPYHKEFNTPIEMLHFLQNLREWSGGKPIGFKLCVGHKGEFLAICKAMVKTGIKPDFITVDGGEGGTGAAPLEFSDSVGMPMRDGLAFVYDALVGFDLKKDIKLIASGKVATSFHLFRALALGADACNCARAFMMALGCIQSLECNLNICPTGVATQKPHLMKGLVVADKKQRVANFHRETIEAFTELLAAAGLNSPEQINRGHIYRNENQTTIMRYDQSYPYVKQGGLLTGPYPEGWQTIMDEAVAESFHPSFVEI